MKLVITGKNNSYLYTNTPQNGHIRTQHLPDSGVALDFDQDGQLIGINIFEDIEIEYLENE